MKTIVPEVNQRLEFINSVLLTSRYNEITTPFIGYGLMTEEKNEYTDWIFDFFAPFRSHPVYSFVEEMIPNGFLFSRPVELALAMDSKNRFTLELPLSDLCLQFCGGEEKIKELLALLKDLAEKSSYFVACEKAFSYYQPILSKARDCLDKIPYVPMLEEEYGREQESYHFVVSSLMRGNYGIHFDQEESGKSKLYSVFATDNFSLSPMIIFHEYSHPFINPLTEKYKEETKKYLQAYEWLKPYKRPGFESGYGEWDECINEHLVRAMTVHLMKKAGLFEDARTAMDYSLYAGYQYLPALLEQYDEYDKKRDVYPDFEAFYKDLLKVFEKPIEKSETKIADR